MSVIWIQVSTTTLLNVNTGARFVIGPADEGRDYVLAHEMPCGSTDRPRVQETPIYKGELARCTLILKEIKTAVGAEELLSLLVS